MKKLMVLVLVYLGLMSVAMLVQIKQIKDLQADLNRLMPQMEQVSADAPQAAVQESGSETPYTVPVSYAPLPPIAELEQEFSGRGTVSDIFDGRPFKYRPSCANIDQTPGQREMTVKHFDRVITSEEAIAEMDLKGYRPAIHLEVRDFAKANPDLQRKHWIVALGSFVLSGGGWRVAVLCGNFNRRFFDGYWFGDGWDADYRFLFVRKSST